MAKSTGAACGLWLLFVLAAVVLGVAVVVVALTTPVLSDYQRDRLTSFVEESDLLANPDDDYTTLEYGKSLAEADRASGRLAEALLETAAPSRVLQGPMEDVLEEALDVLSFELQNAKVEDAMFARVGARGEGGKGGRRRPGDRAGQNAARSFAEKARQQGQVA